MENPQMYPQIHQGSAKECEVDMVGEEYEVYCEDGRWRSARAHRSCWPRRSYLAHVKASYLLRVRNLELRVLKIAISSLSICRGVAV